MAPSYVLMSFQNLSGLMLHFPAFITDNISFQQIHVELNTFSRGPRSFGFFAHPALKPMSLLWPIEQRREVETGFIPCSEVPACSLYQQHNQAVT